MAFQDKKVIVTGGSRGIGLAISRRFVCEGAEVLITGRNEKNLQKAKDIIASNQIHTLVWDISDTNHIERYFANAISILGGLDVIVNNAGVLSKSDKGSDIFSVTPADWDYVMDINAKGVYFLIQVGAKYMIKNNTRGHIVNICSNMGFRKIGSTPYGISKWALRGMTQSIGRRLARDGIVVNGIAPGPVTTEMMDWCEGRVNSFPHIPIGRYSEPEEIADLAFYLAMSDNIVGQIVIADGGEMLY